MKFKFDIPMPLLSRMLARVMRGNEIPVFLTIMGELRPLTMEFIKHARGGEVDLRGRLDEEGKHMVVIPMKNFGMKSCHYQQLRDTLESVCKHMAGYTREKMMEVDFGKNGRERMALLRFSEKGLRRLLDAKSGYVELPACLLEGKPEYWLPKLYMELAPWKHMLCRQFKLREFVEWIFPRCDGQREYELSRFKSRLGVGLEKLSKCLPEDHQLRGVTFTCRQPYGKEEVVEFRFNKTESDPQGQTDDYGEEVFRQDLRRARTIMRTLGLTKPQIDKLLRQVGQEGIPTFMTTLGDVRKRVGSGKVDKPAAYAYRCLEGSLRFIARESERKEGKAGENVCEGEGMSTKVDGKSAKVDINVYQNTQEVYQSLRQVYQNAREVYQSCQEKAT